MILALGFFVATPVWWWTHGIGAFDAWTLAFLLWQAMPFAVLAVLYGSELFSAIGTIVTGLGTTALTILGSIAIERSESSTASIGYLYLPIWYTLLVVAACVVDLGARAVLRRIGGKPADAAR